MTKLGELKVGDKFRFAGGQGLVYELLDVRIRENDFRTEWLYWTGPTGFCSTAIDSAVELITDPPEPKYRPYSDLRVMLNTSIRNTTSQCEYVVTVASEGYCKVDGISLFAQHLLDNYTYLDGTPCGELVE